MVHLDRPKDFNPNFTVVSCVFLWNDMTLLLHRSPYGVQGNKWGMPGGKAQEGEKISSAMIREIKEETGIAVPSRKLVHFRTFYVNTLGREFVYELFTTSFDIKPDVQLNNEHTSFKWVPLKEVLCEKLVSDHPFCMKYLLREMRIAW